MQIHACLKELAAAYPDLVTLEILGKSYLGNDMPLVKISNGGSGKPAVWVDGSKLFLHYFTFQIILKVNER